MRSSRQSLGLPAYLYYTIIQYGTVYDTVLYILSVTKGIYPWFYIIFMRGNKTIPPLKIVTCY